MHSSDAARAVGNRGIPIHGGMGFTWENDLHLSYRRAKSSETAFIASMVIDSSNRGDEECLDCSTELRKPKELL
jgi:hypothetical protein